MGQQKDFMCSADAGKFIEKNHLDLSLDGDFNPRDAFGSHDSSDHVYKRLVHGIWALSENPNSAKNGWTGCRLYNRFQMISHGAWYRRKRSR